MNDEHDPQALTFTVALPDELLHTLADVVAARVSERLQTAPPSSPWLNLQAAADYLGFSRDRLYKLTAARAIPFRKKRDGQGLLFHRGELDRWLEREFPPTGCAG